MSGGAFSADGLYYWDGARWVTTLSPDGRSRWDGQRWVPLQQAAAPVGFYAPPAYPIAPQRPQRVPTSWTRPLQLAVAGAFVVYGLYTLSTPFWLGAAMGDSMRQTALQQAQNNPALYPDPNQYADMMAAVSGVGVAIGVLVGLAIAAVGVAGALKRWTWVFYAVLVVFALAVIGLPFQAAGALGLVHVATLALPAVAAWAGVVYGIAAGALGAWMLIALITRGPWAMRRASGHQ